MTNLNEEYECYICGSKNLEEYSKPLPVNSDNTKYLIDIPMIKCLEKNCFADGLKSGFKKNK